MEIAGFWRRLLALVLDCALVGVFGLILGWLFTEEAVWLGTWGRWVGFGIALLYFGLMNSHVFDGKTFGKMVMGIRVVGTTGMPIPLWRSFVRYAVLGFPFFLNGAVLPTAMEGVVMHMLVAVIVFGGMFATIYLYVFNRRTRQSLHDLVVRTVVVRHGEEEGRPAMQPVWRGHAIPVLMVAILALFAPLLAQKLVEQPSFEPLLAVVSGLQAEPGIQRVQVMQHTTWVSGGAARSGLMAMVQVRDKGDVDEAFAERIHQRILELHPEARRYPFNTVHLWWGYDLGIASWTQSHRFNFRGDAAAPIEPDKD